jgi:hypothetical protein
MRKMMSDNRYDRNQEVYDSEKKLLSEEQQRSKLEK